MSPEQVKGKSEVDRRTDLWALACMVYECLTGATVWSTEEGLAMTFAHIATAPLPDPNALRPDLPSAFKAWLDKALARAPEERFQTAAELAEGLVSAFELDAPAGALDSVLIQQLLDEAPETELEAPARTQRPARSRAGPRTAATDRGPGPAGREAGQPLAHSPRSAPCPWPWPQR